MNRFNYGWLAVPAVLLVWFGVASQFPSYIFPGPVDVYHTGVEQIKGGEVGQDILISLQRLATGFLISALLAFLVGIMAGAWRPFRQFLSPLVSFFQATPPMAWAPLLIILLGLGNAPMVAVIIIASFFPILLNVMQGMRMIPETHIRAAKSLGAKGFRLAFNVYLPEIIPAAISGLNIGFAISWRSLVAAEMIGGNAGIGYFIAFNGQLGDSAAVLFGIIVIGLLALVMEWLILKPLQKRYAGWAERAEV